MKSPSPHRQYLALMADKCNMDECVYMAVLLLKLRMGSSKYVRRLRLGVCEQSALHRVCARVWRLDDRRWSGGGG